jgi:hypothetical protein
MICSNYIQLLQATIIRIKKVILNHNVQIININLGVGLGLAICKQLIGYLGPKKEIDVETFLGKGS